MPTANLPEPVREALDAFGLAWPDEEKLIFAHIAALTARVAELEAELKDAESDVDTIAYRSQGHE